MRCKACNAHIALRYRYVAETNEIVPEDLCRLCLTWVEFPGTLTLSKEEAEELGIYLDEEETSPE